MLLADGLEDAFMGIAKIAGEEIAVYDAHEVMRILQNRDGMTYDDARDFMDANILYAFVGPETPAFFYPCGIDDLSED